MHKWLTKLKKLLLGTLIVTSTILSACNGVSSEGNGGQIQIPNPASQYCIDQGGKLIPQKDKDGNEYSLCKLPNGQTIEEWKLFKKDHPQK